MQDDIMNQSSPASPHLTEAKINTTDKGTLWSFTVGGLVKSAKLVEGGGYFSWTPDFFVVKVY